MSFTFLNYSLYDFMILMEYYKYKDDTSFLKKKKKKKKMIHHLKDINHNFTPFLFGSIQRLFKFYFLFLKEDSNSCLKLKGCKVTSFISFNVFPH
jgi:hypothetical protein